MRKRETENEKLVSKHRSHIEYLMMRSVIHLLFITEFNDHTQTHSNQTTFCVTNRKLGGQLKLINSDVYVSVRQAIRSVCARACKKKLRLFYLFVGCVATIKLHL